MRYLMMILTAVFSRCRAFVRYVNVFRRIAQMDAHVDELGSLIQALDEQDLSAAIDEINEKMRNVETQSQESADTLDSTDISDLVDEAQAEQIAEEQAERMLENSDLVDEDRCGEMIDERASDAAQEYINGVECDLVSEDDLDEKIRRAFEDRETATPDDGTAVELVVTRVMEVLAARLVDPSVWIRDAFAVADIAAASVERGDVDEADAMMDKITADL